MLNNQIISVGSQGFTFHKSSIIVIQDHNKTIVDIKPDGNVEFGEGVSLNEASEYFWECVGSDYAKLKEENKALRILAGVDLNEQI